MQEISEPYRSKKYDDMFEASEASSLVAEDVVAYSQSYEKMLDDQAAIAYAAETSLKKGIERGQRQKAMLIASSLLSAGVDSDIIMKSTGLTREELDKLRN